MTPVCFIINQAQGWGAQKGVSKARDKKVGMGESKYFQFSCLPGSKEKWTSLFSPIPSFLPGKCLPANSGRKREQRHEKELATETVARPGVEARGQNVLQNLISNLWPSAGA